MPRQTHDDYDTSKVLLMRDDQGRWLWQLPEGKTPGESVCLLRLAMQETGEDLLSGFVLLTDDDEPCSYCGSSGEKCRTCGAPKT